MSDIKIGDKFNYLTVIECVGSLPAYGNKNRMRICWRCKCDCGNEKIVCTTDLKSGKIKSCGCLKHKGTKGVNKTHGLSRTLLYKVLDSMKQRCYNKNCKAYKNYGARGIKVCDEWLNKNNGVKNFYDWAINNNYRKGLSIDRIDDDGNYCPENCRFVDSTIQNNNKRNNSTITFDQDTYTISEWTKIRGYKPTLIRDRLDMGWTIDKALNKRTVNNPINAVYFIDEYNKPISMNSLINNENSIMPKFDKLIL